MTAKQRHGCLTTYLVLTFISICIGILANIYIASNFDVWKSSIASVSQNPSAISKETFIFSGLLCIPHLVFLVGLLKWKKWGFYGIIGVSIVSFILNISSGLGLGRSFLGLAGIAILYGVLNIGGENRAWRQLE
jgi:hypothetical protein